MKHVKMHPQYGYGRSMEIAARKASATDFSIKWPSKQKEMISSVQSTGPSIPTSPATSPTGQAQQVPLFTGLDYWNRILD